MAKSAFTAAACACSPGCYCGGGGGGGVCPAGPAAACALRAGYCSARLDGSFLRTGTKRPSAGRQAPAAPWSAHPQRHRRPPPPARPAGPAVCRRSAWSTAPRPPRPDHRLSPVARARARRAFWRRATTGCSALVPHQVQVDVRLDLLDSDARCAAGAPGATCQWRAAGAGLRGLFLIFSVNVFYS